jgi:hypothetical protein
MQVDDGDDDGARGTRQRRSRWSSIEVAPFQGLSPEVVGPWRSSYEEVGIVEE